ncbi:hypothetical protein Mal4_15000 [Maioricimonas rarisocia]|uniref:Uncharacterized protein n=1 Tax=Maioricimonas rarisocia TaxID=2528026 RepID=A0A517Z402_9PLAN|nr:hypothetical protein Mal4_15000 [Maioricimonas rarisocia]
MGVQAKLLGQFRVCGADHLVNDLGKESGKTGISGISCLSVVG